MAASEENTALFPIFVLTIMALPLVPYTLVKILNAFSKKTMTIHCQCSVCSHSGKYRKSIFKRVKFLLISFFLHCQEWYLIDNICNICGYLVCFCISQNSQHVVIWPLYFFGLSWWCWYTISRIQVMTHEVLHLFSISDDNMI